MPEDWKHQKRRLDFYILYIVVEGKFSLRVEGQSYVFEAGDVFLMKPGALHEGVEEHAVIFYWLHLNFAEVQILTEGQAQSYTQSFSRNKILFPTTFKINHLENSIILMNQTLHYHVSYKGQMPLTNYLGTATMITLADLYLKSRFYINQSLSRRLSEICRYIDGSAREELSISAIAAMFNYNPSYLSRVFKQYLGISLKEYIIQAKLRQAEYMLLSTTDTISAIAQHCGYSNEFYFMKLFKSKYGLSPSHYRNLYNNTKYTKY